MIIKQNDENFINYKVSDCRDCDNGYSVFFEDSPPIAKSRIGERLTYWLAKSFGFMPKPGDIFCFYGKLEPANKGMYGLDIIRIEKDYEGEKGRRVRTEIFYNPPVEKSAENTGSSE